MSFSAATEIKLAYFNINNWGNCLNTDVARNPGERFEGYLYKERMLVQENGLFKYRSPSYPMYRYVPSIG